MELHEIAVPDPLVHAGLKFIFRTLPEKVKTLNQLPTFTLSVVAAGTDEDGLDKTEFRLYISTELDGFIPYFSRAEDLSGEVNVAEEHRAIEARAALMVHLQKYYGIDVSVILEPPVGAFEDEFTVQDALMFAYQDAAVLFNEWAGAQMDIRLNNKTGVRTIAAQLNGIGRWRCITSEGDVTNPTEFSIDGIVTIFGVEQNFHLTSQRYLHPLSPQEMTEHWIDPEIIPTALNGTYSLLYSADGDIADGARIDSTFVDLDKLSGVPLIDRRSYQV